ncbi:hypothetical protein SGRIM128S_07321 [Streptomyces griseomycini]
MVARHRGAGSSGRGDLALLRTRRRLLRLGRRDHQHRTAPVRYPVRPARPRQAPGPSGSGPAKAPAAAGVGQLRIRAHHARSHAGHPAPAGAGPQQAARLPDSHCHPRHQRGHRHQPHPGNLARPPNAPGGGIRPGQRGGRPVRRPPLGPLPRCPAAPRTEGVRGADAVAGRAPPKHAHPPAPPGHHQPAGPAGWPPGRHRAVRQRNRRAHHLPRRQHHLLLHPPAHRRPAGPDRAQPPPRRRRRPRPGRVLRGPGRARAVSRPHGRRVETSTGPDRGCGAADAAGGGHVPHSPGPARLPHQPLANPGPQDLPRPAHRHHPRPPRRPRRLR